MATLTLTCVSIDLYLWKYINMWTEIWNNGKYDYRLWNIDYVLYTTFVWIKRKTWEPRWCFRDSNLVGSITLKERIGGRPGLIPHPTLTDYLMTIWTKTELAFLTSLLRDLALSTLEPRLLLLAAPFFVDCLTHLFNRSNLRITRSQDRSGPWKPTY